MLMLFILFYRCRYRYQSGLCSFSLLGLVLCCSLILALVNVNAFTSTDIRTNPCQVRNAGVSISQPQYPVSKLHESFSFHPHLYSVSTTSKSKSSLSFFNPFLKKKGTASPTAKYPSGDFSSSNVKLYYSRKKNSRGGALKKKSGLKTRVSSEVMELENFQWPGLENQPNETTFTLGETEIEKNEQKAIMKALRLDREKLESVGELWSILSKHLGQQIAVIDGNHFDKKTITKTTTTTTASKVVDSKQLFCPTFSEFRDLINLAASGLAKLGLKQGDHISIFSENSARWLIFEQGCSINGNPTAVRGAAAMLDELQYIYNHSDSKALAVMTPSLLKKLYEKSNNGSGNNRNKGFDTNSKDAFSSDRYGNPKFIIVLKNDGSDLKKLSKELCNGVPIITLEQLLEAGKENLSTYTAPKLDGDDLATLVYTSGTTGKPKGVMLSQKNLLHQILNINLDSREYQGDGKTYDDSENNYNLNPQPKDIVLSLLPCWHIFERSAELFAFGRGSTLCYSSIRSFKDDLAKWKPQYLIVVPRLLENVYTRITDNFKILKGPKKVIVSFLRAIAILYCKCRRRSKSLMVKRKKTKFYRLFNQVQVEENQYNKFKQISSWFMTKLLYPLFLLGNVIVWKKVKQALGGKQKLIISGGSALPKYLEDFYDSAGIPIISGYGLSETSPVIAVRDGNPEKNLIEGGVVGLPPREVELRVVDIDTKEVISTKGVSGMVQTRGPQIMKGYYKDTQATSKVIDKDGWFSTGDVGFFNTLSNDLILTGRAKDIIVLNNGENIDPQPIEDLIVAKCPLVNQVMLIGQDEKALGALVVLNAKELKKVDIISQEVSDQIDNILGPNPTLEGLKGTEQECNKLEEKVLKSQNDRIVAEVLYQIQKAYKSSEEEEEDLEFRPWEKVSQILVTFQPFTVSNGQLTQTLKMKRNIIFEKYAKKIQHIYK